MLLNLFEGGGGRYYLCFTKHSRQGLICKIIIVSSLTIKLKTFRVEVNFAHFSGTQVKQKFPSYKYFHLHSSPLQLSKLI